MATYLILFALSASWVLINFLIFCITIMSLFVFSGILGINFATWLSVFLSAGASSYVVWLINAKFFRTMLSERQLLIALIFTAILWNGSSVLIAPTYEIATVRAVSVGLVLAGIMASWKLGWSPTRPNGVSKYRRGDTDAT